MKTTYILLITLSLSVLGCAHQRQASFEGTLIYKVSTVVNSDNSQYNDYIKQKYGDKAALYISKTGDMKREFPNSGPKGLDYYLYRQNSNKLYVKFRSIDTVYVSDCSENTASITAESDLPGETIYGTKCKGYKLSCTSPANSAPIVQTFYYPVNKQYIDPDLYKNYSDAFYNKVIRKMQAPWYKMVLDMGRTIVTYELEKLDQHSLDPNTFNVPTNYPTKGS